MVRVYSYMRYVALLVTGLLVVPLARSDAQSGWVSADLGLAAIRASSPYSSSLGGVILP